MRRYLPVSALFLTIGSGLGVARYVHSLEEAEARKAPVQRLADRWAGYFVPTVLALGAVTFSAWYVLLGAPLDVALTRMAALIIACPCALILATPTGIAAAIGRCARRGILVRGGVAIERLAQADCFVFDKTGTLTAGKPVVVEVVARDGHSREEVLFLAATAEQRSAHPLANAILAAWTLSSKDDPERAVVHSEGPGGQAPADGAPDATSRRRDKSRLYELALSLKVGRNSRLGFTLTPSPLPTSFAPALTAPPRFARRERGDGFLSYYPPPTPLSYKGSIAEAFQYGSLLPGRASAAHGRVPCRPARLRESALPPRTFTGECLAAPHV